MEQPAAPTQPEFSIPEVVQLATMDDLDSLSAELDAIDLTLAELDAPAAQPHVVQAGQTATQFTAQSSPSSP